MIKLHLQKCTALLLSLALCLALIGCDEDPRYRNLGKGADTPEEAVAIVMQAYFDFDEETLKGYLILWENGYSETFFKPDPLKNTDLGKYYNTIVSSLIKNQSYELLHITEISENNLQVTILLTYYDCSPLLIHLFDDWYTYYQTTDDPAEIRDDIQLYYANHVPDALANYAPNSQQIEITLEVEQVNGMWYVHMPEKTTRLIILANYNDYYQYGLDLLETMQEE